MLKSVLISVLSACLAVCITLLIQQWESLSSLQHVPATLDPEPKTEIVSQQHQEGQDSTSSTNPAVPAAIDLAQALGLGRILLSRGEHEEAALVYRVASATASGARSSSDSVSGTNRDRAEAQHGLGLALLAAGRADEALEACREAELADPELAAASSCVGALLTDAGDTVGALEALRNAADKADRGGGTETVSREVEGAADSIRGRLGAALLAAGEVDEAIVALGARAGGDPHAAYNLGVAWQSKGETDKAIAAFSMASDLAPTLAAPRVNLGAQLLQSGRLPEAEAVLLSAVELAYDDPLVGVVVLVSSLSKINDGVTKKLSALKSYAKAVWSGGGRAPLMHIAKLHQELGQPQQALEAIERAILEEGEPRDTAPLLQAGLILESFGSFEDAAAYFSQVVNLDPEDVEATTHLGACQERLGQHHEALASFVAASRLEPSNPKFYELLVSAVSEARRAAGHDVGENKASNVASSSPEPGARAPVPAAAVAGAVDETVALQRPTRSDRGDTEGESGRSPWSSDGTEGRVSAARIDREGLGAGEAEDTLRDHGNDVGTTTTAPAGKALPAEEEETKPDTVPLGVGPDGGERVSSGGRGGINSPPAGGKSTKAVPKGGAGSSVRQDSAAMRRQSESLRDDDGAATRRRGFFGKQVVEEPEEVPTTSAGMHRTGDEGDGRGSPPGGSTRGRGVPAEGGNGDDDQVRDAVTKPARSIGAGAADGSSVSTEESVNVGGEWEKSSTAGSEVEAMEDDRLGTPGSVEAALSDSSEGMVTLAEPADTKHPGVDSIGVDEVPTGPAGDERFVVSSASEESLPTSGGEAKEKAQVDLPLAAGGATATSEAETTSQREGAVGTSDEYGGLRAEKGQEGMMHHPLPATDTTRGRASLSMGSKEMMVEHPEQAEGGDSPMAKHGTEGSSAGPQDWVDADEAGEFGPAADFDRPAAPSSTSTHGEVAIERREIGSKGLDKHSTASVTEASTRDNNVGSQGATADEEVAHAAEEGAARQEEMEAARQLSTNEVADGYDSPAGAEVSGVDTHDRDSDRSSVAAPKPDAEWGSDSEGSIGSAETGAKDSTVTDAYERGKSSGADARAEAITIKDGDEVEGGETAARMADDGPALRAEDAVQDRPADARDVADASAADHTTESAATSATGTSGGKDADASTAGSTTGSEGDEAVAAAAAAAAAASDAAAAAANVAAAAADVAAVVVSEDDARRARAKAKLGLAKLQQGQAKKAASLFEKAASIDPGWWGGFYYAALAHDALGDAEAAAGALVSALGVSAPAEDGEVAELAALSSKVLATLGGGEQGAVAGMLKSAMETSGLSFSVAPSAREPSPRINPVDRGGQHSPGAPERGGSGSLGNGDGGRTATMGGGAGGAASSGSAASRTGVESDFGKGEGPAAPSGGKEEAGTGFDDPYSEESVLGGGGGGSSRGRRSNRGSDVPTAAHLGEVSAGDPLEQQQDRGRAEDWGRGGRQRERGDNVDGVGGRDSPSQPNGRRRSRGRDGQGWEGEYGDVGSSYGVPAGATGTGQGSGGGGSSGKGNSKASVEDMLASMGLTGGSGLGADRLNAAGGSGFRSPEEIMARTPQEMMAASSSGGSSGHEGKKKKGLFGGFWKKKGKT
ncbi:unnamed protein product [Scytosiphon promiscuus]